MNNNILLQVILENYSEYIIAAIVATIAIILISSRMDGGSHTRRRSGHSSVINKLKANKENKDPEKKKKQNSLISMIKGETEDDNIYKINEEISRKNKPTKKNNKKKFIMYMPVLLGGLNFVITKNIILSISIALFGIYMINKVRDGGDKKKISEFIKLFPIALDIIIRGVRGGIPVNECFRLIRQEAPNPIAEEFGILADALALGATLEEGMDEMSLRVPIPEIGYLKTVLVINRRTGGNLSNTLLNLNNTIRERKRINDKSRVMMTETRITALVTISLPLAIPVIIYFLKPDYISVLFNTEKGKQVLTLCIIWMSIGIFILKKMYDSVKV